MNKVLIILLVFIFGVQGQGQDVSEKVDSVLINQNIMMETQSKILSEVKYIDNLAGKKYGVELNLVNLLLSSANDALSISGTFSLFNIDRNAEIAFPFYYDTSEKTDRKIIQFDGHYRRFLGEHQNGFYISVGTRFSQLTGPKKGDWFWDVEEEIITENKMGIAFGIGYRKFGRNGLYWGTSLIGGRYFADESELSGFFFGNGNSIIDVELLKFGIAI